MEVASRLELEYRALVICTACPALRYRRSKRLLSVKIIEARDRLRDHKRKERPFFKVSKKGRKDHFSKYPNHITLRKASSTTVESTYDMLHRSLSVRDASGFWVSGIAGCGMLVVLDVLV